jgi:CMP/dCMP kinase
VFKRKILTKKINIALDGYSSCGKSTLAKDLAKILAYIYVDTGAMYRTATLWAMQKGWANQTQVDTAQIVAHLDELVIDFRYHAEKGVAEAYLAGVCVEAEIRSLAVANCVSLVSQIAELRKKLVFLQQEIAKHKGVVMDGRDIGSVVMPDAELKLFVTASPEVRAKRRYAEMLAHGQNISLQAVAENLAKRDQIDSQRTESPLLQAPDAVLLDNSNLTRAEQLEMIKVLVEMRTK